ncbi:dTDP-4-dehydrorhamnose reductase [Lawsonella clevelandensis]|uniref:dTDP-4-dehydrorhamnose reductase n=1 Tax=Lawsonella clevelandensis TaxID=1528099 RepID=A0A5E3ZZB6_9ACTN|nr:dTDP-4-dehydrorhamnose reductase [Lawsonella clevelandensis]MDU7192704.1 dTDP-4-dehydrorhamnose reductase [Lawsonella clevelandensis]VHO01282.1 dTDP-4-dehydrorhamnose reductase [Lawsonella clevelandensis]
MTTHRCRIHIVGASGQLGYALLATQPAFLWEVGQETPLVMYSRRDCDLSDPSVFTAGETLMLGPGDIVLNCAAYTAVDAAEENSDLAYRVNAEAPGELAALCRERGAHLVHLSTDYVFGGQPRFDDAGQCLPWETDDPVSPSCVYGASKAAGEAAIMDAWAGAEGPQQAVIVRTSWLFTGPQRHQWGVRGRDFVTTMQDLYREKGSVTVVNDQRGCPTYSLDLAWGLWELCQKLCHGESVPALLHATNSGFTTWFEFAQAIISQLDSDAAAAVHPCTSSEFPTPAARPSWSVLSSTSWQDAGLTPLRSWQDALREALADSAQGSLPTPATRHLPIPQFEFNQSDR